MQLPVDNFGKVVNEDFKQAKPIAITSVNLSL